MKSTSSGFTITEGWLSSDVPSEPAPGSVPGSNDESFVDPSGFMLGSLSEGVLGAEEPEFGICAPSSVSPSQLQSRSESLAGWLLRSGGVSVGQSTRSVGCETVAVDCGLV